MLCFIQNEKKKEKKNHVTQILTTFPRRRVQTEHEVQVTPGDSRAGLCSVKCELNSIKNVNNALEKILLIRESQNAPRRDIVICSTVSSNTVEVGVGDGLVGCAYPSPPSRDWEKLAKVVKLSSI